MTAHAIGLLLALTACAGPPPAAEQKPATTRAAGKEALLDCPIDTEAELIIVPVRVRGKTHQFVLDTCASHNMFDETFRRMLGEPKETLLAKTGSEPIRVETFYAPEGVTLGKIDLQRCGPVCCLDLERFRQVDGRDIRGIIGMGTLRRYVVRLDFDAGRLTISTSDDRAHPEWGRPLRIRLGRLPAPYLPAAMKEEGEVRLYIDTGANSTGSLRKDVFDEIVQRKKAAVTEAWFDDLGGRSRGRSARIGSIRIGADHYKGLIFNEGNLSSLGLDFLSRHVVTFDFPNLKMYLKKGRNFARRDESDMSGLHVYRLGSSVTVHSVDAPSPARKAGIKAGDVVLKVNGTKAEPTRLWSIRKLLRSGDGKEVTLTLRRGQRTFEATFRLKRRI
jgi:hypothetical protein